MLVSGLPLTADVACKDRLHDLCPTQTDGQMKSQTARVAFKLVVPLSACIPMSDDPVSGSGAGTNSSGQLGDGSGSAGDGRLLSAIRRSGVPIVMVQSTEDALIGSPLALVLQQEVG